MLTSRSWFGHVHTTLHEGEGTVHAIEWHGPFIAWANETGIKVYDCIRRKGLTHISKKALGADKEHLQSDTYRPCLAWGARSQRDPRHSSSLVIGWGDVVTVAVGVSPEQSPATTRSLDSRAVHYQRGISHPREKVEMKIVCSCSHPFSLQKKDRLTHACDSTTFRRLLITTTSTFKSSAASEPISFCVG